MDTNYVQFQSLVQNFQLLYYMKEALVLIVRSVFIFYQYFIYKKLFSCYENWKGAAPDVAAPDAVAVAVSAAYYLSVSIERKEIFERNLFHSI